MTNPVETDKVTCSQCGHETTFQKGLLSESQKLAFRCSPCLQNPVVENQVTERQAEAGGRRLLTEDLPEGI